MELLFKEEGHDGVTSTFPLPLQKSMPTTHHKKIRTQQQKRGCEKSYGVDVIIPKFWLVDMTDPEFEQKTGLKSVLRLIRDPKQGFSKLATKLARILYKKFERQNWGPPDEEDDEALCQETTCQYCGFHQQICLRYV